MEETREYKNEIAATRKGALGSSDGRILAQVAALGFVPKSAYKRMAIVKGLIPQEEIPKNAAILAGDDIENIIYDNLKAQDPRYQSNPLWVSEKYSRKNCRLISHPDYVLQDDARKVLNIFEVKTTKFDVQETRQTYKAQLYIHYLLGLEKAHKLGKDWRVRLFLVHYSTEGIDLANGVEYDPDRLTIKEVRISDAFFDAGKAMDIVNDFLETFDEYYSGDEVDSRYLPEKIKEEFDTITTFLSEIKEREAKIDEFKKRLYSFMLEKDVKSIKSDKWNIVRIDSSTSHSFDAKKYMSDLQAQHPRKAKKILQKYDKETKKNGYCQIKLKNDD